MVCLLPLEKVKKQKTLVDTRSGKPFSQPSSEWVSVSRDCVPFVCPYAVSRRVKQAEETDM